MKLLRLLGIFLLLYLMRRTSMKEQLMKEPSDQDNCIKWMVGHIEGFITNQRVFRSEIGHERFNSRPEDHSDYIYQCPTHVPVSIVSELAQNEPAVSQDQD